MRKSITVDTFRRTSPRCGVTLLELLVAMGVVGLLAAILIPAVMQSRGTARRDQCESRMRQLGVAVHNYADVHGFIPASQQPRMGRVLYPFLGDPNLFGRNPLSNQRPEALFSPPPGASSALICPSDELAEPTWGHVNFSFCDRARVLGDAVTGSGDRLLKFRDVVDGLSHTVFASEVLISYVDYVRMSKSTTTYTLDEINKHAERLLWYKPTEHFSMANQQYETLDHFVDECRNDRIQAQPIFSVVEWDWAGVYTYNHLMPPNTIGCADGPPATTILDRIRRYRNASVPASSRHIGLVNVLAGDGSVHAINNSIDLEVWRNLGTDRGGDIGEFD